MARAKSATRDTPAKERISSWHTPVPTRCPQTLNASTPIYGIEAFELFRGVGLTHQNAKTIIKVADDCLPMRRAR